MAHALSIEADRQNSKKSSKADAFLLFGNTIFTQNFPVNQTDQLKFLTTSLSVGVSKNRNLSI